MQSHELGEPLGAALAAELGALVIGAAHELDHAGRAVGSNPRGAHPEVGIDDLLAGRHMSSRVCPHCGHPPDDFGDEETVIR